jgi:hypothetical protein
VGPCPTRRLVLLRPGGGQAPAYCGHSDEQETSMKSIILWLCGVPIGVIILLKVFGVF